MKPSIINIVTILMLASIVGCHSKSSIYMQLELVDTLLRHDNDTAAYHVLNTIMDLDDEEGRAYYYLLKTQTDYKLYREIFSDSIINLMRLK